MNMNTKTGFIAFLGVMVMASLASAYSFEIMSSTYDSVQFQNGCQINADCKENGKEYCGEGQIQSMMCDRLNGICNVTCKAVTIKPVGTDISASFTVLPKDKRVGHPVELTVKDKTQEEPIICYVEIYYGGRWESEQAVGAKYLGSSMTIATNFINMNYINGTFLQSAHTDRQGTLTFIPNRPGRYVLKLLTRFVVFSVGDSNGNTFNCSNDVCETALGEDTTVCPQDCKPETTPIVPPVTCVDQCGDGVCQEVVCQAVGCPCAETVASCPEDCALLQNQSQNQSGQQGVNQGGQQGGDMTMLIVIVVVVVAILAVLVLLMRSGKLKMGTTQAVQTSAPPTNCPKCGTNTVPGCQYCINCGARL